MHLLDGTALLLSSRIHMVLSWYWQKRKRTGANTHSPWAQTRPGHKLTSDPRMLGKTNLMAKTKVKGTEIHPTPDEAIEGGRAKNCSQQCSLAQQRSAGGDIRIYW